MVENARTNTEKKLGKEREAEMSFAGTTKRLLEEYIKGMRQATSKLLVDGGFDYLKGVAAVLRYNNAQIVFSLGHLLEELVAQLRDENQLNRTRYEHIIAAINVGATRSEAALHVAVKDMEHETMRNRQSKQQKSKLETPERQPADQQNSHDNKPDQTDSPQADEPSPQD